MKKTSKLRVPVTQGMKDIYGMDMHLAYQAACAGKFNVTSFGRLAAAVSVIRTALDQRQAIPTEAITTLDKTIEVLLKVKEKGDTTEVWEITEAELPVVLDGIMMAEQWIGTLDLALLEQTAANLLRDVYAEGQS